MQQGLVRWKGFTQLDGGPKEAEEAMTKGKSLGNAAQQACFYAGVQGLLFSVRFLVLFSAEVKRAVAMYDHL